MNTMKFTEAMGKINDKYVSEANKYQKSFSIFSWKKCGITGAVALFSAGRQSACNLVWKKKHWKERPAKAIFKE